jgi:signal transduction histidine kinase
MPTMPVLQDIFAYLWHGPPLLPPSLKVEWRFVVVRWIGIIFVAPGLPLAGLPMERMTAAYTVLTIAAIYNVAIHRQMLSHPGIFTGGFVTTAADALLSIGMVQVGGGFESPFYHVLYTVTISASMRYGYGPSLAMAFIIVGLDIGEHLNGNSALNAPFVFRSGFLCLTAVLASYLREQARRAESALQHRLREADLLNSATATLGASLAFEPALREVAAAASHFFGSKCAVLVPSPSLDDDGLDTTSIVSDQYANTAMQQELATLCERYAEPEVWQSRGDQLYFREVLRNGQEAIVLLLGLLPRPSALATLALAVPAGTRFPSVTHDILESFVERMTLAVENASLYRAVANRTDALQQAYAELATAHQELLRVDEMKTGFLANVSHDFRTPLTSIRSFSEMLLSYDEEPEVQREFLQIINSESERLTRMVNDVLDITKIESGHMDWRMGTVDLAALIDDSGRTYTTIVERDGLAFVVDVEEDLPLIHGDRDRLQQVIGNLIDNALKFTRKGEIRLTACRIEDEIRVSLADTGVGIPPEYQEMVFGKFQQIGQVNTVLDKPQGAGLGLSICREIVEYHDGRLWVESEPGVGSTFAFTLPIPAKVDEARVHALEPVGAQS